MTVADRIRALREERQLSQSELAKRMGYSNRSMISKIEAAGDNITLKIVTRAATALDVTEAYLMGWYDDSDSDNTEPTESHIESNLSPNEQLIIDRYRGLPDDKKTALLGYILAYTE